MLLLAKKIDREAQHEHKTLLVFPCDTTGCLYNDVHMLFGGSDSLGPSPGGNLALVQFVNLSCGTAM